MGKRRRKKKSNVTTVILAVVAVITILLCAALAAGYVLLKYYYGNSNYINDADVSIDYNYMQQAKEEGALDEGDLATLSPEEASEVQAKLEEAVNDITAKTDGTYSILLIGTDRRTSNWHGNSDAMILFTINDNSKKIYMTSFMRDLYANIPGVGARKLNAAHANGGGPLLVATLESNYAIDINNYATVDFNSMSTIIDMMGGVNIDVTTAEAGAANTCIQEMCQLRGIDPAPYYLQGGGVIHLNGIQAVAYGRIRRVGNSDYERTSRQREVLTAMLTQARSLSVPQLADMVNQVVPLITHNLQEGTILELIAKIPSVLQYEIVTERIPYDGLFYSSNEMLIPDMEQTINRLHATIYAAE